MKRNYCATLIQKNVRMFLAKKTLTVMKAEALRRQELIALRKDNAACILTTNIRGWLIRKEFLKAKKAAVSIQSLWRGYKTRKLIRLEAEAEMAKKIAEMQRRVSEAAKNATDDKKLCNRTAFALDYLLNSKDMAMLIQALTNLGKWFVYIFCYLLW